MKKQILAIAVATAFSASAMAADVQLYGAIDSAIYYSYNKAEGVGSHSVAMKSDIASPSRWGLKATEDLGNGYSVSFRLENGFNSDDGSVNQDMPLFRRESRLTFSGPFGELSAGRMGSLTSSAGYYDLLMGTCEIYDGGMGTAFGAGMMFNAPGRMDNTITYASPSMSGFTGYLQYSSQIKSNIGAENKSSADRYYGVGALYSNGPLNMVLVFDATKNVGRDDTKALSLGATYDFGVAKLFAVGQYGKNEIEFCTGAGDGYSLHLGAAVPVNGGTLKLGSYFGNVDNDSDKWRAFNLATSYEYAISKRTYVYGGIGYRHQKIDTKGTEKWLEATVGIDHSF